MPGPTTAAGISQEFENILLSYMIPKPDDPYIMLNSGIVKDDTELFAGQPIGPGTTFHVDQPTYLTGTFTEASRALTDGTAVSTTSIGIAESQYTITVKEYGGPYDQGNSRVAPVAITEFLKRRAKHDQAAYLAVLLKRDYGRWLDAVIQGKALGSTNITTADGTAVGSIVAGKLANYQMLTQMVANLETRNIPRFPNGQYRMVISPRDEQYLKQDATLQKAWQYQPPAQDTILNGYIGSVAGFDFIRSNTIPTAAVGGGGAVTGYQSIAYGAGGAVGFLNPMPVQARRRVDDDFQRQDIWIWIAHHGIGALDLNWVEVGITT